jgi:hypothetical protein
MFSTLFSIALFVTFAIQGLTALSIDTPALTQCKDVKLNWDSTKGPYNLIVVHADDPCGDPIVDLGDHDGTSLTWKVNIPAGTKVQLSLEDATGEEGWSGKITVAKSNDDSCLSDDTKNPDDSKPTPGTTLVVTPTTTVPGSVPTSAAPSAVGAAGNAAFPNGAVTVRQASTPVMVLGALAAVLAVSL